jgi:nucleotide-binding universal stress UspA family protein
MKRILVGIDGSPESRNAADFAARLARNTKSGIELAHVLHDVAYEATGMGFSPHQERAQRTDRARMLLSEWSESVPLPLTPVETSLLEGSPAYRLAQEAKRDDIWLVVVGHRGRGAVQRVLLGSTADRLAQLCPKPVIVVR